MITVERHNQWLRRARLIDDTWERRREVLRHAEQLGRAGQLMQYVFVGGSIREPRCCLGGVCAPWAHRPGTGMLEPDTRSPWVETCQVLGIDRRDADDISDAFDENRVAGLMCLDLLVLEAEETS